MKLLLPANGLHRLHDLRMDNQDQAQHDPRAETGSTDSPQGEAAEIPLPLLAIGAAAGTYIALLLRGSSAEV